MTAVVLVGIGYTNFSSNSSISNDFSNTLAVSNTNNIGDVQLVSSSAALVENNENDIQDDTQEVSSDALVSNDEYGENTEVNNVVETSSSSNTENQNYFSQLKMERNNMYSKSLETYQKIIDSSTISSDQKAIAIQETQKINNEQNSIQIAEELIKLKGFEDVVIYCSNGKVSVIVRVAALSNMQVAQIQNIVSKELNIEVSDITISNK